MTPMDFRLPLLMALERHVCFDGHEEAMRQRILTFVRAHPDCFERSLLAGHVTGSAWIINPERTMTLLTHHAKLDKWLQPGGHADGDPDVLAVARREMEEESGLRGEVLLGGAIFDVDAHDIPARGETPAHVHYDVRFAFEADPQMPLRVSDESHALAWVPLDAVADLATDGSVLRMVAKTRKIPFQNLALPPDIGTEL